MPKLVEDLTGKRFGRWTVSERAPDKIYSGRIVDMWHCICDCGAEKDIQGRCLRGGHTHSCGCYRSDWAKMNNKQRDISGETIGHIKVLSKNKETINGDGQVRFLWNCVCTICGEKYVVEHDKLVRGAYKICNCYNHRFPRSRFKALYPRLYSIYQNMRERCNNEKNPNYRNYGARGISICDDWLCSFDVFAEWSIGNGYDDSLSIDRIDVNDNYCPENCRWANNETQANNKRNNVYIYVDSEKMTISQASRKYGITVSTISKRLLSGWDTDKAIHTPTKARNRKEQL